MSDTPRNKANKRNNSDSPITRLRSFLISDFFQPRLPETMTANSVVLRYLFNFSG